MASNPAPGRLEVVRQFVNTVDVEKGTDELGSPGALSRWLELHELLSAGFDAGAADMRRAIGIRAALRSQLGHHSGLSLDPAAAAVLDEAAEHCRVGVRFSAAGASCCHRASGVDGALGELLASVADAMRDGTWARLKLCLGDDCRWAYYDHSRNRSASWCDMRVCGNRAKVRAFRERASGDPAVRGS